jgi:hypothetical protein
MVTALNVEVVSADSGHQVVPNAPNMCITPAAPSPLPLPYPITGSTSELDPGTEKTKINDKKVLNSKGKAKTVHGNEAGTQKDVSTGQTGGHAWPFPVPALVVHFEGVPVTVTGSPGLGNSS